MAAKAETKEQDHPLLKKTRCDAMVHNPENPEQKKPCGGLFVWTGMSPRLEKYGRECVRCGHFEPMPKEEVKE